MKDLSLSVVSLVLNMSMISTQGKLISRNAEIHFTETDPYNMGWNSQHFLR